MTNLSDLLPAGAASKQLNFVATGAISNGQAVGLKSDGTVAAISPLIGSTTTFASAPQSSVINSAIFDPDTNKIVIVYRDAADSPIGGKCVIGTVSGMSISFGTPVEFESARINSFHTCAYDSSADKVVVAYQLNSNNHLVIIIGTVSGTSISFGSKFESSRGATHLDSVYDATAGKVIVSYVDSLNSSYPVLSLVTISGTTPSVSGTTVAVSAAASQTSITYDTTAGKTALCINGTDNSLKAHAVTSTSSSISVGSATTLEAAAQKPSSVYIPDINRHVVVFSDSSNRYGEYVIFEVSGTSIANNTSTATFKSADIGNVPPTIAYDTNADKVFIVYRKDSTDKIAVAKTGTASTSALTLGNEITLNSAANSNNISGIQATFDSNANKIVCVQGADNSANNDGNAFVFDISGGPASTDFLGIADAAISNGASGKITMKGGVATNSQLLPQTYSASLGSEAMFLNNRRIEYTAVTYDTTNDKVIVAYADPDSGSGVGMAAVGTVSGTSISWGTPVQFSSSRPYYIGAAFEATEGKVVLAYRDSGNSNYGYSVVGTVSGTSISFGTPVEWMGAATVDMAVVAIGSSKVVVLGNNNSELYGKVGTVSGTSISFGSAAAGFGDGLLTSAVYDSNAGKVVVAYRDQGNSNYGTACVLTISGTSISLGTEVVFNSGNTQDTLATAFDPDRNEVGIFYQSTEVNDAGYSNVGTVSGTSISFSGGSPFTATSGVEVQNISATYATNSNQYIVVFEDRTDSGKGKYVIGTSTGTISFTTAANFDSGNTDFISSVYDPDQNTTVITYKDEGNSGYGTAIGLQMVGAYPNLVPNTTYYVQDDGTISTTSSSVTAGKAMSTNSINLDYSS